MRIGFLLLVMSLIPLDAQALLFKVGDYAEYEIYINDKYEHTESKKIISYDADIDVYEIERTIHPGTDKAIVTLDFVVGYKMFAPESDYDQCVTKGGRQAQKNFNGFPIRTCQIFEFALSTYSKEVPFNFIESVFKLANYTETVRLLKFRPGGFTIKRHAAPDNPTN